ncbi:MAG TPA: hypothetical protein VIU61_16875 [Kofleriaceae bacterium]
MAAKQGLDLGGSLEARIESREGATWVGLSGDITEAAKLDELLRLPGPMRIDLGGIRLINSLGVRAWYQFVGRAEAAGTAITVERLAPVMVSQISMIKGFMGSRTRVASILVPYFCQSCGTDDTKLFEVRPGVPLDVPGTSTCPKCKGLTVLDELETMYPTLFDQRAR